MTKIFENCKKFDYAPEILKKSEFFTKQKK